MPQTASNIECLMSCLVERFLQRSSGYLLQKCTAFMGKNFPCIPQGMNKAYLINKIFEIFQHYAPLCVFFQNYANYALRAELCDFASAHNTGSPVIMQELGYSVTYSLL